MSDIVSRGSARRRLGDVLIDLGMVSEEELQKAIEQQKSRRGIMDIMINWLSFIQKPLKTH